MCSVRLDAAALGTFVDHLPRFELQAFYVLLGSVSFWHCPLVETKDLKKYILCNNTSSVMWTNQTASFGETPNPDLQGQCTWPWGVKRGPGRPASWTGSHSQCCRWDSWRAPAAQTAPQTQHKKPAARLWWHTRCRRRPGWTTWLRQSRKWWHLWGWGCAAPTAGSWVLPHFPPAHARAPHPCICVLGSSSFLKTRTFSSSSTSCCCCCHHWTHFASVLSHRMLGRNNKIA